MAEMEHQSSSHASNQDRRNENDSTNDDIGRAREFKRKIWKALRNRDLDSVKDLVQEDGLLISTVFMALGEKFWDAFCYIIQTCPSALKEQENGLYPIHRALCEDIDAPDFVLGQMIEACPESTSFPNKLGEIPIVYAMRRSSKERKLDVVKLLADVAPESLMVRDREGMLPLHRACYLGYHEFIQILAIKRTEAIRVSDDKGDLPLHLALKYLQDRLIEIMSFLVREYPQSLWIPGYRNSLPIHMVAEYGFRYDMAVEVEVAQCLLSLALLYGESRSHSLSMLVATDGRMMTPLHRAAVQRRTNLSLFVMLACMSPEALCLRDDVGRLPVDICRNDDDDRAMVACLLCHKKQLSTRYKDWDTINVFGSTPIHHFARFRVDFGSNRNEKSTNVFGSTPIHHFARFRVDFGSNRNEKSTQQHDIMQSLMELQPFGASTFDRSGNLPLFYAAEHAGLATIYLLVQDFVHHCPWAFSTPDQTNEKLVPGWFKILYGTTIETTGRLLGWSEGLVRRKAVE